MRAVLRTTTGLFLLVACLGAARRSMASDVHFALARSAPEADATVEAPRRIALWFTEEPQEGTTAIRLLDASEEAIEVGEVMQSEEDAKSFSVAVLDELDPGAYTVAWRGMGPDGHVVRNTFAFTVTAH